MSVKQLLLRDEARTKLLAGATALTDAVRVTLGPKSKCVLVDRKWAPPLVCNDGVTIAKQVELADPVENLGARMLREAASRTGDAVGDGTTTATLLAHALFAEGLRNVAAGASAIDLKHGLDVGLETSVRTLRELSRPVTSKKDKAQVATISGHNDVAMGELVADAMERVGSDGAVTVEEAKGTETVLEVVEGLQFDHGYLSPYFVTVPERMEAVLEEPSILLHEKRISNLNDLIPLLEEVAKAGRPLLVIAEDVEGEALATLVINKLRGTLTAVAVKAPGYGERRRAMLEDIALLTGGKAVTEELGVKLANLTLEALGSARRVVVGREHTTIVGGKGSREAIAGRIQELKRELERTKSDYDREKLEERLAKLSGGVAVIRVGAPSEAEMKNRKEAFDDAIAATKAAVAEGIVPGGGLALLRCAAALESTEARAEGDVRTGLKMLRRALEAPARQIAINSGFDGGVIVERMKGSAAAPGSAMHETGALGFDAAEGRFVDMFVAGIVDPTKVVRIALENAVSVAGTLLLAEGTLTEVVEKEPKHEREREPELV
ncbi:MAG: chaperonin GroEL [Planctomycetes bacterium]|nr:chaperonin GroEL [Planctomycetota bacterium]